MTIVHAELDPRHLLAQDGLESFESTNRIMNQLLDRQLKRRDEAEARQKAEEVKIA
jgi:hypothetical protein